MNNRKKRNKIRQKKNYIKNKRRHDCLLLVSVCFYESVSQWWELESHDLDLSQTLVINIMTLLGKNVQCLMI